MKKNYNLILKSLLILLMSLPEVLQAQPSVKIAHYSTEDGLSHDVITTIFKDKQGFMWFGTWNGINRFDGHNFKAFTSTPGDRSLIKNDRVDQIFEDDANHLWIKSYDGEIYRFDKRTEKFLPLSMILRLEKKIIFNKILAIKDGVLWVSTIGNGVLAVDHLASDRSRGYLFSKSSIATQRLPSDTINFFFRQSSSVFWVGTGNGLVRIKRSGQSFQTDIQRINGRAKYNFTSATAAQGKVFFGTTEGLLISIDSTSLKSSSFKVSNNSLNGLITSRNNQNLYLSSASGALIAFNIKTTAHSTFIHKPGNPLFSIFEDSHGDLWIEPEKYGVVYFNAKKHSFSTFTQKNDATRNIPNNHFRVFEDKNGRVWSILRDGGFGYFSRNAEKFEYFYNEPGSAKRKMSNLVINAQYDPSGVMWIHTDDRGLEKVIFHPNEFKLNLLKEDAMFKSENEVRGIFCDQKNRLWAGTKSGKLYIYRDDKKIDVTFNNLPAKGMSAIYTIFQDKDGNIWLGTKDNGLFIARAVNAEATQYNLSHFEHNDLDKSSIASNQIYSIAEDPLGQIWVGTFGKGLDLVDNKNQKIAFRHFFDGINGYPHGFDRIRHIQSDKSGRIWLGTTNGLVIAKRGNQGNYVFDTYHKLPGDITSLGNNDVQYIFNDYADRMWLATSGGGLNLAVANPGTGKFSFKIFSDNQGLGNNYLLNCRADLKGVIWMATKSSLSSFDPKTGHFRNFNSYNGVPMFGFSEASTTINKQGELIFGTIKGFLSFDPAKIKASPINANLVFTGLQVNNEDVKIGDKAHVLDKNINETKSIQLRYNQNIISIDYAVLDYRSPGQQSFAFRLKGFDTNWRENKNQNRITYTNLPPGNYQLEVKCMESDNYLNIPSKKIDISILPPLWQTWWAYVIYIIIVGAVLFIGAKISLAMLRLRQRIAVEQKMTALKMAFFTNVSHELRTPLTLIRNPIEEVIKQEHLSERGKEYLSIVQRSTDRMVRFVNQLLDMRKVQSGQSLLRISSISAITFLNEVAAHYKAAQATRNVRLTVQCDSDLEINIDAEKLETVVYNLLSNSFKYSPAGSEVILKLTKNDEENKLIITVNDEGCGVPESELEDIFQLYRAGGSNTDKNLKGTGIGLALAKELVELHEGTITAENLLPRGLSVTITLPVKEMACIGRKIDEKDNLSKADSPGVLIPELIERSAEPLNSELKLLLLIEDNEDMRNFLASSLSAEYRIRTAADGVEGLALARKIQPDVILSDVMMPKMDGIELLRCLKEDQATSHLPIILLSAKSAIESQITGLNYGADFYLGKPFDLQLLLAAIANTLKQRKLIAEHLLDGRMVELSPSQVVVTSKDEVFLKKVINVVEEKMADPEFNIDTVAETVNMARATFFKKFKSLTQQAPVEFVRDMRLKRAKQFLDSGAGNITEIAYTVGFSSSKYFSTCFKAQYGVSPSDYLRSPAFVNTNKAMLYEEYNR